MTDQTDQANQSAQAPSAEDVLDELLRTLNDSLRLAGAVIRGDKMPMGGGSGNKQTMPTDQRLHVAHQIIEAGAGLAEKLGDLQKTRSRRQSVS